MYIYMRPVRGRRRHTSAHNRLVSNCASSVCRRRGRRGGGVRLLPPGRRPPLCSCVIARRAAARPERRKHDASPTLAPPPSSRSPLPLPGSPFASQISSRFFRHRKLSSPPTHLPSRLTFSRLLVALIVFLAHFLFHSSHRRRHSHTHTTRLHRSLSAASAQISGARAARRPVRPRRASPAGCPL